MKTYILKFILKSDATFSSGGGVAGIIDTEVEHDEYGFPFLRGRTLKGLLVEECANILYALELQQKTGHWPERAKKMFGSPGSTLHDDGVLRIGDACLPADLRNLVQEQIGRAQDQKLKGELTPDDVLDSLTHIRRQTSMTPLGVPEEGSLRSARVILRGTPFESQLTFSIDPDPEDTALLAACVKAFRRAGVSRNRGRGLLSASLWTDAGGDTKDYFARFLEAVS